ncbi:NIPSNAP family protein [Gracilibacillus salinarum]|uniref:NIPSNAP family protein n=1 Tax=Gracilibacillus salinarum TaxID=2932255 RepID=A0ABY4GRJ2_9BACI|nr:NIPSNAP family protein [Gracilibacillus salinarum]UOQ86585.1 NIPSNAP family protein [Gracilibacillus salinarum]
MIYRRKMYHVDPSIVKDFNEHFNKTLLPTQLKYGARLVGRWMTEDKDGVIEIFAIWEYSSFEDYEQIESKVKGDDQHVKRVQQWFEKMGRKYNLKELFYKIDQDFLKTTVPVDKS